MPILSAEKLISIMEDEWFAQGLRRLGAHCIDWMLVNSLVAILLTAFCENWSVFVSMWKAVGFTTIIPVLPFYELLFEFIYFAAYPARDKECVLATTRVSMWTSLCIDAAYFVIMESSPLQATLGKWIFRICVADSKGQRITVIRAFVRYLAKSLSSILLLMGYMLIGFTPKKQCLHDLIAGTYVIRKCEQTGYAQGASALS